MVIRHLKLSVLPVLHTGMRLLIILAHPTLRSNTSPNLPKGSRRLPRRALTRNLNLVIQLINLLQRKTLGLIDHKVHKRDTQEAAAEPDEEDLGLQIGVSGSPVDEVGSAVGDGPVQEPVCGGCHGEALGADFEGEDFASHDPLDDGYVS